jgi:hypothetical protein
MPHHNRAETPTTICRSSNLTSKRRYIAKAEARPIVSYETSKGHDTPLFFIMALRIRKDKIDALVY